MSFYEKTGSTASGSDHRRKWDSVEYQIKAQERIAQERDALEIKTGRNSEPKTKKELLQARNYSLDLDSQVGKSVVLNKTTTSTDTGGFYCEECDCTVKDSISYLDHKNGKNHQRNCGRSMTVKKDTLEDVRNRFDLNKNKGYFTLVKLGRYWLWRKKRKQLEELLEDVQEEEMKLMDGSTDRKRDYLRKRRRVSEPLEESPVIDPKLQEMMGFGGFAGSKN